MPSKAKAKTEPEVKLVHRVADGRHRLELHSLVAEPEIGDWASSDSVAQLHDFRGTTLHMKKLLPSTFRVTPVKARVVKD